MSVRRWPQPESGLPAIAYALAFLITVSACTGIPSETDIPLDTAADDKPIRSGEGDAEAAISLVSTSAMDEGQATPLISEPDVQTNATDPTSAPVEIGEEGDRVAARPGAAQVAALPQGFVRAKRISSPTANRSGTAANGSADLETVDLASAPGQGLDGEGDADKDETYLRPIFASAPGLARLAPNGLRKQTGIVDVACLRPQLVSLLKQVERHFGKKLIITSGYRSPARNRAVRGAKNSFHMYCAAADIQMPGVSRWQLASYLRGLPGRGGVGTYCHTRSVHIDIGPKRDWDWGCRRRSG